MLICSPLNKASEVDALAEAGADEFYAGLLPEDWKGRYSHLSPLNRREWPAENFPTSEELAEAVRRAHAHGAPVYLTLNAQYYTAEQHAAVLREAERARSLGVDALIVGDVALMLALRERGLPVALHASTVGSTYNRRTAALYQELGASRIVLPRHLTIAEVARLRRGTPLELEVFVLNALCSFDDGYCTFQHALDVPEHPELYLGRDGCHACRLPFEARARGPEPGRALARYRQWKSLLTEGTCHFCGACAIPALERAGVDSVKIVGRLHDTERKLRDVGLVAWARDLASRRLPRDEYVRRVRERYLEVYGFGCEGRCYPVAV